MMTVTTPLKFPAVLWLSIVLNQEGTEGQDRDLQPSVTLKSARAGVRPLEFLPTEVIVWLQI